MEKNIFNRESKKSNDNDIKNQYSNVLINKF